MIWIIDAYSEACHKAYMVIWRASPSLGAWMERKFDLAP
jgi:hypothetical protein